MESPNSFSSPRHPGSNQVARRLQEMSSNSSDEHDEIKQEEIRRIQGRIRANQANKQGNKPNASEIAPKRKSKRKSKR